MNHYFLKNIHFIGKFLICFAEDSADFFYINTVRSRGKFRKNNNPKYFSKKNNKAIFTFTQDQCTF